MPVELTPFAPAHQHALLIFCQQVYVEIGWKLDLQGKHADFLHIADHYHVAGISFFILWFDAEAAGTVAVRALDDQRAELKRLYLLQRFHGQGHGCRLLLHAVDHARRAGFAALRLDTTTRSLAAIRLFEANGFRRIDRYNDNPDATHFYELDLRIPPVADAL